MMVVFICLVIHRRPNATCGPRCVMPPKYVMVTAPWRRHSEALVQEWRDVAAAAAAGRGGCVPGALGGGGGVEDAAAAAGRGGAAGAR